MDIVTEAAKKLQEILLHSGCEEGDVILMVNPGVVLCQYEKGACMEAYFGGRTGEFTTFDPVRAKTKMEFMFGAPLDTPATRGAACAILNVVTAFLCLSRNIRACPASHHAPCINDLTTQLAGKRVFILGTIQSVEKKIGRFLVNNPDSSEIILVNGDGLIASGTGDIIRKYSRTKTVLFLGPSTAGISSLEKIERFCPYGT